MEKKYLNSGQHIEDNYYRGQIREECKDFIFLSLFLDEIIALAKDVNPGVFEYCSSNRNDTTIRREVEWRDSTDKHHSHIEPFSIKYFWPDMVCELLWGDYDNRIYYNFGVDSPEAFIVRTKFNQLCSLALELDNKNNERTRIEIMDNITNSFPGIADHFLLGEEDNDK